MRTQQSNLRKKGGERVELAVTLSLLCIAVFSIVEITHHWHVEKMLKLATYEAVKAGCAVKGGAADADRMFREHARALGIQDARLLYDRSRLAQANVGRRIRFQGVAPTSKNLMIKSPIELPFFNTLSSGHIFYRKEGN